METIITIFLILHIAAGFIALGTGLSAILVRKGSKPHNRSGLVYFWAMVVVAISAFVLSGLKNNSFLFMVGLFTLYMTMTGRRALKFKKPQQTHTSFDWVFLIATAVGAIIFLAVLLSRVPFSHGMMPVIVTFGGFLLAMLVSDAVYFAGRRRKISKNYWLLRHITRMMGAYIATTTAFIVTNIQSDPAWIAWLAPTVVFSPLITYYKNKYRGKSKKKAPVAQPAATI